LNEKNTTILGPIRRILFIVAIAIIVLLLCFIYINHQSGQHEYEDKLIINVFGKQRMYTQMLSKDANRLTSLLQSQKQEEGDVQKEDIRKTILEIKANMLNAKSDFSNTLVAINKGHIDINSELINIKTSVIVSSVDIRNINQIWSEFETSIDILINSNEFNSQIEEAINYINDNNENLLYLCEKILETVLEDSIKQTKIMMSIAFALIGLLFVVIIVALIELWRYVVVPFDQLFKGIAEIGLNGQPMNFSLQTRKKVMPIVAEISSVFKKINYLISLIENINNNSSFMDTLKFINRTFSSFVPYNYIGIALIDEDKRKIRASYGVSDGTIVGLPQNLIGATWLLKETSLGELFISGNARIINDLEAYTSDKPKKTYNELIMNAGIKASITLPLVVSGKPMGMIFFSSNKKNVYTEEHLKFLSTLANSIAISLQQNIFIDDIIYSSILALAKLAEARDEDTGDHMERMKIYSKALAEVLHENNIYSDEITLEFIDNIERFSPLHDIGKVGIRDGILLKPGKLTTEEFQEMKHHTMFGSEVLRSAEGNMKKKGKSLFGMGIEIAEGHHEKWDGSGYPHGKKGNKIPLSARIVAVADVLDALTSKRPYKEAYPFEVSVKIIKEGRGSHFDPLIVDVFLENQDYFEKIYLKNLIQETDNIENVS
jgi:HD-GYP domain-containing protein (c-di-GMP phosphodiesterase class II)